MMKKGVKDFMGMTGLDEFIQGPLKASDSSICKVGLFTVASQLT